MTHQSGSERERNKVWDKEYYKYYIHEKIKDGMKKIAQMCLHK